MQSFLRYLNEKKSLTDDQCIRPYNEFTKWKMDIRLKAENTNLYLKLWILEEISIRIDELKRSRF